MPRFVAKVDPEKSWRFVVFDTKDDEIVMYCSEWRDARRRAATLNRDDEAAHVHDYETRCTHERVYCHVCGEPEPLEEYATFLRNKLDELTRDA